MFNSNRKKTNSNIVYFYYVCYSNATTEQKIVYDERKKLHLLLNELNRQIAWKFIITFATNTTVAMRRRPYANVQSAPNK